MLNYCLISSWYIYLSLLSVVLCNTWIFFEMLNLKLKMEEAKFCISDLAVSAKSPSLDGDTFTAYELLSILINFTNPCFNDGSALLNTLTIKKGSKRYSCCSQNILASISVFEENCSTLLEAGSLLESIEVLLQSAVDSIQEKCIHLVWNLLHYTSIKEKDISGIISLVQSHQKSVVSRVRITSACALYLFHAVKTGMYLYKYISTHNTVCDLYNWPRLYIV